MCIQSTRGRDNGPPSERFVSQVSLPGARPNDPSWPAALINSRLPRRQVAPILAQVINDGPRYPKTKMSPEALPKPFSAGKWFMEKVEYMKKQGETERHLIKSGAENDTAAAPAAGLTETVPARAQRPPIQGYSATSNKVPRMNDDGVSKASMGIEPEESNGSPNANEEAEEIAIGHLLSTVADALECETGEYEVLTAASEQIPIMHVSFRSIDYLRPPFRFLVSFPLGFSLAGTGTGARAVALLTVYPPFSSGTMSTCTP